MLMCRLLGDVGAELTPYNVHLLQGALWGDPQRMDGALARGAESGLLLDHAVLRVITTLAEDLSAYNAWVKCNVCEQPQLSALQSPVWQEVDEPDINFDSD
jgi:hypothetical protein